MPGGKSKNVNDGMKVLQVHIVDKPAQFGGAEKVMFDLTRYFYTDEGIDVLAAVNPGSLHDALVSSGVKVVALPEKTFGQLVKLVTTLRNILKSFRPDIAHSHHRYITFTLDLLFKGKVKILHTAHIEMFDKKRLSKFGHHVAAVSEAVKRNLVNVFRLPESKITVIYNGIPLFNPNKTESTALARELGVEPSKIVIGCIARLEEQKGHRYLIEAISLLPEETRKALTVLLIGDGSLREKLRQEVKKRGLNGVFHFLGYRSDIAELLSLCGFTVLPSLWEGLPLTPIESYLQGKPVIATTVSGTPEVVLHEQTGLLVPPDDSRTLSEAILQLINHPELVTRYGNKGRRFAESKFALDRMVKDYKTLYCSVLSDGR